MTDDKNVVDFYPKGAAASADNILKQAVGAYDQVLIIGWAKDGSLDARATLGLKDGGDVLWLVEVFKTKLMNGDYMEQSDG
jgi:hypothetical protein